MFFYVFQTKNSFFFFKSELSECRGFLLFTFDLVQQADKNWAIFDVFLTQTFMGFYLLKLSCLQLERFSFSMNCFFILLFFFFVFECLWIQWKINECSHWRHHPGTLLPILHKPTLPDPKEVGGVFLQKKNRKVSVLKSTLSYHFKS